MLLAQATTRQSPAEIVLDPMVEARAEASATRRPAWHRPRQFRSKALRICVQPEYCGSRQLTQATRRAGRRAGFDGLCKQVVDVGIPTCDHFMIIEQHRLAFGVVVAAQINISLPRSLHVQGGIVPSRLRLGI